MTRDKQTTIDFKKDAIFNLYMYLCFLKKKKNRISKESRRRWPVAASAAAGTPNVAVQSNAVSLSTGNGAGPEPESESGQGHGGVAASGG